ncbi:MAG TPA: acyl-CoA dehydratase activase [Chitinivibrionales bacterium]|nr:acyl-CoA dehydratase activase [Chitinivibrionales bacterium]
MQENLIAGIDIGSTTTAVVLLDKDGSVIFKDYQFHNGNVYAVLEDAVGKFPVQTLAAVGVVAEKGREFFKSGIEVNEQVAIIEGVKHYVPKPGSIITIGGETFCLILFDPDGQYKKYISNSACAAGTGSFLDQQAARLGLSGSAELSELARSFTGVPPKIATRCAVFAKTDLIHMQQKGYDLATIAAGLSLGIAQNICNTLFHGIELLEPIVVVGGVSKNKNVLHYLQEEIRHPLQVLPDSEYMGAIGAALIAGRQGLLQKQRTSFAKDSLLTTAGHVKSYHYPPLSELKSAMPDFSAWQSYVQHDVEIDIYEPLKKNAVIECYLGIDIGSTSTKATLMNRGRNVVAGLYTRTGGQPITALQRITRSMEDLEKRFEVQFTLLGTGTTGSGRKFIQKVSRAEYVVDEITAHARAAYHLRPDIDTIIEIGGQDAKFTVMHNGNVTFSVMNYVCAAGTGSFIEEQARRLGVTLDEYAALAENHAAPLISDRCTVFMQRDLSHMLSLGYSREELLAAALHSVRDNYLSKVAHVNKIGSHITFQGATAKNHALVRAFEQKLQKPIYVSKFCHLTGALGVCLKMADADMTGTSRFRKDLHTEQIVSGEYVCGFCNNNCKIKTIEIEGETVGWGYLCGRDEHDPGFQKKARSGFDLLRNHRKVFDVSKDARQEKISSTDVNLFREFRQGGIQAVVRHPGRSLASIRNRIQLNGFALRKEIFSFGVMPRDKETVRTPSLTIGLAATLTMLEYIPLWELFFKRLGFATVVSSTEQSHVARGKEIQGADYCAPMTDFHGHIRELASKADYIFYPQLLENTTWKEERSYCYYCHYAVPIIQNIPGLDCTKKMIAPVLNLEKDIDETIRTVFLHLPDAVKRKTSFVKVEAAFYMAWDWYRQRKADLLDMFRDQAGASNDIGVVFIGRPYLVLHQALNKGLPAKLADMGIQSFYMDMVPVDDANLVAARDFVRLNHWHYGNRIIKTAETVAQTERLFPIYVTAFKCSPDSFLLGYFKDIMEYYQKPYLILQLDEHEAGEGYDTRLEAAVETFLNFRDTGMRKHKPAITFTKSFEDKTYLLAGYDLLSARFIQGVFIHAGIKSLIIEQTPDTATKSLQFNDGQCLPVSALTQGILHTIRSHGLDPAQTVFFSNSNAELSCNLPQYPVMIKQTLEKIGQGMEKVDIMVTDFLPTDLPLGIVYGISMAHVLAGLVQKIAHKIRAREKTKGETDKCLAAAADRLAACFSAGTSKEEAFKSAVSDFLKIEQHYRPLPQVGIVGDLYVRDNDVFNQDLIRHIEEIGAEAITVPFIDTMNLQVDLYFKTQWQDGRYLNLLRDKVAYNMLTAFNRKLNAIAKPILHNGTSGLASDPLQYLQKHSLTIRHAGETSENLLKVYYLKENYPDLKLIINAYPIFCCPGLISEAIYKNVEKEIGIPIVSITYDGTRADKNKILNPYLYFLHKAVAVGSQKEK